MENNIIYLPIFGGFYNSIHDIDEDYLTEDFREENEILCKGKTVSETQDIFDKKYEIDYDKYRKEYCDLYVDAFKEEYGEGLKKVGFSEIKYKSLYSPREYNYGSDEINIEVEYDFDKIVSYLKKNKEEFTKYIEKANKSYDGFSAYGTTYFDKYIDHTFEPFELTQIMNFYIYIILKHESEDFLDLHYKAEGQLNLFEYLKENEINITH